MVTKKILHDTLKYMHDYTLKILLCHFSQFYLIKILFLKEIHYKKQNLHYQTGSQHQLRFILVMYIYYTSLYPQSYDPAD